MWKLLRNFVIVALVCVVALKLVLWYEVREGAARLVARLAPAVQAQYGDVSAGLDGSVALSDVTVTLARDHARETWRAARVDLGTPGALWLVKRLLTDDDALPEHLSVAVGGLQAPAAAFGTGAAAINPISMVPFETLGCGIVSRFSVTDYQRMGLNPGTPQLRVEYRYDAAASTLTLSAELASPPFSSISGHLELQKFDPRLLANWQKLHAGEISIAYNDNGYLAKRNRFCAQQAGIAPAQFLDQHVAAIDAYLQERGVQPSAPVEAIYRSLVADGGRVSLLSLPPIASTLGQLLAESPDVMIRQLNLTARRNDAPPVMVRIAFTAPPQAPEPAAAPLVVTAPAKPGATPAPVPAIAAPVAATAAAPGAATAVAQTAPKPAAPTPPVTPPHSQSAPATSSAPATTTAATPPRPSTAISSAKSPEPATAPQSGPEGLPSGERPPEGSTLALVWKPTVDRLQPAAAPARDYDVIEYSALNGYAGRTVRLLTSTGKKVEGRVIAVDNSAVGMRIQQPGGVAELQVPRNVIVEIQVPRAHPADEKG